MTSWIPLQPRAGRSGESTGWNQLRSERDLNKQTEDLDLNKQTEDLDLSELESVMGHPDAEKEDLHISASETVKEALCALVEHMGGRMRDAP